MRNSIFETCGPLLVKVLAGAAGVAVFAPLLAAFLAPVVG